MTVVSFDPDTTLVPSLVKARQLTADLWPLDAWVWHIKNVTISHYSAYKLFSIQQVSVPTLP